VKVGQFGKRDSEALAYRSAAAVQLLLVVLCGKKQDGTGLGIVTEPWPIPCDGDG
jgi:hypothetical protein